MTTRVHRPETTHTHIHITGRARRAMRASDRVATHHRRCLLDRHSVTTCDRSCRGRVWRVSPKFQLTGTADLRVSTSSSSSSFAILRERSLAVLISGGQWRNEDSSEAVIEDIDCSRLYDSEYVVRQARHSRVLFTRAYKSQRVRSRRKTIR